MPASDTGSGTAARGLSALAAPLMEWAIWVGLAALVYVQTGFFDEEIAEYRFGATGWPRVLCLAVVIGATGQLLSHVLEMRRGTLERRERAARERVSVWRWVQRIGIFVLPLIYLWFVPDVGFYLATPVFILGLLLLLEVRSPLALIGVTTVVYGLVLLLFTRLFYVALPVGRIEAFYDINNKIIELVRWGV